MSQVNKEQDLLLELQDIELFIGSRQLLESVNLQLHAGEVLTIVGPNGAGKTTLLRVALGLMPATAGTVYRKTGLNVGYMPQKLQIDSTFPITVRRFLSMAGQPLHDDGLSLLQEVGATHVMDSSLQSLSGGEMQRVMLARALARDPDLLVLDEPVQGVDVHGQRELYQLINHLRDDHSCSVLMVSHDLHLVMAATDRVLCLNRHICCSGTPESVTNDPAYIELFGQQALQHLALYSHDPTHHHVTCEDCREGKSDG